MTTFAIRPVAPADRDRIAALVCDHWGASTVVVHGTVYAPADLPGFVALVGDEIAGLVTYHMADGACEVVTLDSLREGQGIGTALLEAVAQVARQAGCQRVWLITTNDNLPALGFYQRRGFRLVAVHPGAVDAARALKPQIPLTGHANIPIHDELELALEFTP